MTDTAHMDEKRMPADEPRSITPPADVFDRPKQTIHERIMEQSPIHVFTGKVTVPPEGGMNLYHEGVPYPKKGFPFPQAAMANNIAKRQTMMLLLSLVRPEMGLAIAGFILTPYKTKVKAVENVLEQYIRSVDYILADCYLQPHFMTPCTQQIQIFVNTFLVKAGIKSTLAVNTARIVATMIEWDDSYRYRIEDIASETDAYRIWKDPRGEIRRLLGIFAERDKDTKIDTARDLEREGASKKDIRRALLTVSRKISLAGKAISALMLVHPKVKTAFREAIKCVNWKYLQLDEADRYHVLMRDDYDFMGRSLEERAGIYDAHHRVSKCCGDKVDICMGSSKGWVCRECGHDCEVEYKYPKMIQYQQKS